MSKPKELKIGLQHLRIFVVAAVKASQKEAAAALECSQSNVSKKLDDLELWLGYEPFTDGRVKELTPEGSKFLKVAEEVLERLDSMRRPIEIAAKVPAKEIEL